MFRRKRAPEEAPPPAETPSMPTPSANGYQVSELPTFHGKHRKVVVYSSDANGRIIKKFKKV